MIRLLLAPLVRLWRGIPEHADRRLANRCDLGSVESSPCRFGPHEWQGSFIGERFCYTHGGHSVAETPGARCPRADA